MKLQNCYGVFDTVSVPGQKQTIIDVDECPNCSSEDLVISKKKRLMKCENCGTTKSLLRRNGLSDVIKATLGLLPVLARDAFVASQKVSTHVKEEQAKNAIIEQSNAIDKAHGRGGLMKETAKMLTRLSIIWQFREHGDMYGKEVVKHLGDTLSLRDSVLLILHQNKTPKSRAIALGLVWNHCVRALAMELFKDTIEIENEADLNTLRSKWQEIIHSAFAFLSSENLEKYEKVLMKRSLKEILDEEMPPETEGADYEETVDSALQSKRETSSAQSMKDQKSKSTNSLKLSTSSTAAAIAAVSSDKPLKSSASAVTLTHQDKPSGNGKETKDLRETGKGKKKGKGHKVKSPSGGKNGSPKIEDKDSSKQHRKKTPIQKVTSEPNHKTNSKPHKNGEEGSPHPPDSNKLKRSKKIKDGEDKEEEDKPEKSIELGGKTKKTKKGHKDKDSEEDVSN